MRGSPIVDGMEEGKGQEACASGGVVSVEGSGQRAAGSKHQARVPAEQRRSGPLYACDPPPSPSPIPFWHVPDMQIPWSRQFPVKDKNDSSMMNDEAQNGGIS